MKLSRLPFVVVTAALFVPAFALVRAPASASELATQRRIHGVITAIDGSTLTIASEKASMSGKLDPARTRVTKNGKPARTADLEVTAHVRAELCLDDVWVVVDTH